MSRPWIKIWVECLDNPKVATLSLSLRGIWFTTLLIAERYAKEGLLPPADRFALMAHTDEETVEKAFVALAKKGLIEAVPDGYRVHDWEQWQVRKPSDEPKAVYERVKRWRANHRGDDNAPVTPDNALAKSVTPDNASNAIKSERENERRETTQREEMNHSVAAKPPERVVYLPAFEVFWKAYGKFVGKKEAHDCWKKLAPDTALFTLILAAVEGQRAGRKWREGYQPDAVRWLKGEHWNDAVEEPRPAATVTPLRTGRIAQNLENLKRLAEEENEFTGIFQRDGDADDGLPAGTVGETRRALSGGTR